MAKYSKTELDALFTAIEHNLLHKEQPWFQHICNLYDKLSGVKYSKSKNTYEFITKGESK